MEMHKRARSIVDTLSQAGFIAYYAGGWVRDYLLNHPSDDIDIATNAPPEVIQSLFPKTVPIGIAFGIILVIIDQHQYEVATFRQDLEYQDGRRPSRIAFCTAIEDAKRRDFTINGMFFDPATEKVLDYVGGQEDLQKKIIRAIGDPHARIQEDRLRMIRAVRFACRFHFEIAPKTEEAIKIHAKELFPAVAIERVWQELSKGNEVGKLPEMLLRLHEFGLLGVIFQSLETVSLDEIEKRLSPTKHYPKETPAIAFLLPLFSKEEGFTLCKKLKLPNEDLHFVTFLDHCRKILNSSHAELFDWAYLYANPLSEISLAILSDPKKHVKRREELKNSIQRILQKNPVVQSSDLMRVGIAPGKKMGELLKAAERIAINEQIDDPTVILDRMKDFFK